MKKLTIIFSAIAICFGITINSFAQKGKPSPTPSSNIPVRAVYEPSTNGVASMVTMDIAGSEYAHGADNVSALFQIDNGSRDLTINLRNSTTRSVLYNFSQVTDETKLNVPGWVTGFPQSFRTGTNVIGAYNAKIICSNVTDGNYDHCNHKARITTIGISVSGYSYIYRLLWNAEPANPSPANLPEATSYVNVHYQVDANGKDVFTITPLPNCATPENQFICPASAVQRPIAGLEATFTGKGKAVDSNAGQYIMPFTLVVSPL